MIKFYCSCKQLRSLITRRTQQPSSRYFYFKVPIFVEYFFLRCDATDVKNDAAAFGISCRSRPDFAAPEGDLAAILPWY